MNYRVLGIALVFSLTTFNASGAFADVAKGLRLLEEGKIEEAAAEFQSAFEQGDGDGAFYLGRLFEVGVGVEPDASKAANLFAAGVERGSVQSMNRLGILYQEGNILLRDYAEAARLFCLAAEKEDPSGLFNCGLAHFSGQGVPKDVAKATGFWERADAAGSVAAQNFLGQLWLDGDAQAGVVADREKALQYFQKTADVGNALGLYQLAVLKSGADGSLAASELEEAYMYAALAAVRGMTEASELRDRLELQMSAQSVTKAQEAAKAWTEARMNVEPARDETPTDLPAGSGE